MLNLAQVAFDAYCKHRSGITYDAKPIPSWDNLTPEIREAWGAAAHAILRAISESFMNGATGQVYISEGTPPYMDVANDLARKELFAPPTSGTLEFQYTQIGAGVPTSTPIDVSGKLRPPTFQERHDANAATLAEIHGMVWGDAK